MLSADCIRFADAKKASVKANGMHLFVVFCGKFKVCAASSLRCQDTKDRLVLCLTRGEETAHF